ncbi:hypothetical protein CBR_g44435 [Chara braunii]|uniref:CR-type domain-containing protein n=1 Tax=Chara braunii TaxID=69332 RepID=A0A388LXK1_CHABU|nr:hypothetical protein CBR_g44435 [Chara braunii]|eukprot:GBG86981.1 hypothetical protein CBR_g44435 [Chara braunii]
MAGHVACAARAVSLDLAYAVAAGAALPSSASCAQSPPSHCGLRGRGGAAALSPSPRHGQAGPASARRSPRSAVVSPRAVNQDTLFGVAVGIAGIAAGIGIPIFYETQMKGSELRGNNQPCFPCNGTGTLTCRFCLGEGATVVDLGGGESQRSKCINCDGNGARTCTTCSGSGIQPRYLDRREFKDDD